MPNKRDQRQSTMPSAIEEPGLSFSYVLIDFSTLPHEWFLSSEHMEERLLAILGQLGDKEPEQLIEEVVSGIDRELVDLVTKNKYFRQLRILAQLRSFTQTKKVKDIMLKAASFFKVEKDPFYKQGEEKGIEKGAEAKSYEFVSNLILHTDFNDALLMNT